MRAGVCQEPRQFSHCAAGTGYGNGVGLIFGQNAGRAWLLGFIHPGWGMTKGETFPIQVIFDGRAQFELFATADTDALATAILPNNTVLEQFRKSQSMVATLRGQTFQFALTSTGQLVPVVANCVAKVKGSGLANAGDLSILPPKPATPTTPARRDFMVGFGGAVLATTATSPANPSADGSLGGERRRQAVLAADAEGGGRRFDTAPSRRFCRDAAKKPHCRATTGSRRSRCWRITARFGVPSAGRWGQSQNGGRL